MQEVKLDGNVEVVKELHKLITKCNDYIQHPDAEYLVDLVSEDLLEQYGRKQLVEVAQLMMWQAEELPALSKKFSELFQLFNERYYGGDLPSYKVLVCYTVNYFETSELHRESRVIRILASSEPVMVARLLGEMARVATTDEYGEKWNDEANRLAGAGAPIDVRRSMLWLTAEEFIKKASFVPSTAPIYPDSPIGRGSNLATVKKYLTYTFEENKNNNA